MCLELIVLPSLNIDDFRREYKSSIRGNNTAGSTIPYRPYVVKSEYEMRMMIRRTISQLGRDSQLAFLSNTCTE